MELLKTTLNNGITQNYDLTEMGKVLALDLNWFSHVLATRLKLYWEHECDVTDISQVVPPGINGRSPYAQFLLENKLNFEERLLLVLALIPHLQPQLLDQFFVKNATYDKEFTEFGGVLETPNKGFLPTGETALFLLAGDDLNRRLACLNLFGQHHLFSQKNILTLDRNNDRSPYLSGQLRVNEYFLDIFTGLDRPSNQYSMEFPAQPISTTLEWEDLILSQDTLDEVMEIMTWIEHGHILLYQWEMLARIKPGYRAIFHGPPGTGKTLTATLLGKATGKQVYRIDLSKVVSKYIGETEKNLARVFDHAENKDWILFFDEADALFGKRTQVNNAHDRYANQEVSYLLQRIEDFAGVIILASNMRSNLDDAFTRRFQSIIHFPMPDPEERLLLWEKSFSKHSTLEDAIDLEQIARDYQLAGGSLINVVRYCSLEALKRNSTRIILDDLEMGIRKEMLKAGKTS